MRNNEAALERKAEVTARTGKDSYVQSETSARTPWTSRTEPLYLSIVPERHSV